MNIIAWNGKPVSKPGIYRDIGLDQYHGQAICPGPSVSSSGLRRALEENRGSPAHFYAEWSGNPNRIEPKEKDHFVLGKAVHHLLLGMPKFAREFIVRPDEYRDQQTGELKKWNGNAGVCVQWLKKAAKEGRTVLTSAQIEDIKGMAISLGKHPMVRAGILNGQIERSIIWCDKETGLWIKVRPDAIPTDSGDSADLKTCLSVQWIDLMRSITDFAYHQQGALIRTAYREVLKMDMASFSLMFVEKKPPYCARRVQIKPGDLDLGERQNRRALNTIAECIAKKSWPGPGGAEDDAGGYIDIFDNYRERADEQK